MAKKPHQKEFLDKAKNNILTVDKIQLQTYKWTGTKGTVLLLHGWESNVFRWRNLIDDLKKKTIPLLHLMLLVMGILLVTYLMFRCITNVQKKLLRHTFLNIS
ncbi:hypothetical protein M601_018775 [Cellulophaga baltica 4]|nr:hypothetical protein M601_018775 [Cellulophaga baltica 4]